MHGNLKYKHLVSKSKPGTNWKESITSNMKNIEF